MQSPKLGDKKKSGFLNGLLFLNGEIWYPLEISVEIYKHKYINK